MYRCCFLLPMEKNRKRDARRRSWRRDEGLWMSKLPNKLANDASKWTEAEKNRSKSVKNQGNDYRGVVHRELVPQSQTVDEENWTFWGVFVTQFVVNNRICGQKVHWFFPTMLRRHILAWFWQNFWPNPNRELLLSQRIRQKLKHVLSVRVKYERTRIKGLICLYKVFFNPFKPIYIVKIKSA